MWKLNKLPQGHSKCEARFKILAVWLKRSEEAKSTGEKRANRRKSGHNQMLQDFKRSYWTGVPVILQRSFRAMQEKISKGSRGQWQERVTSESK